jgi:DNA-binding NarL/FixJ family response regulator
MIRVAIVDDESLLRSGLHLIIGAADDLEVVCSCTGTEALVALARTPADVVLLDIRMPGVDGLTILRELRGWDDPPVVAMLTTFGADEMITEALRAGAAGYLLKDSDSDDLTAAIRALATGQSTLSPAVARTVFDGFLSREVAAEPTRMINRLSPREREVLTLLADGLSNGEIGARLYLSSSTIKDYVSAVLGKLGTANRVQAAVLAHRAGLGSGHGPSPEDPRRSDSAE